MLRDFQKVLNETQILITPNEEHKTVFGEKSPTTGWRKARTLKDYLVRAQLTNKDTKESKSAICNGKRCQVCQYIETLVSLKRPMGIITIFVKEL